MDSQQEQKLKDRIASLEKELILKTEELQFKSRELEIEAALDQVRARAMAMSSSAKLSETSAVLFNELKGLQINATRTSVGIFDDEHNAIELWTTFSDKQKEIKVLDYVNLHIHPVFENIIPARQQNKPYALTVLAGNEVREYYQTLSTYLPLTDKVYHAKEFFYSFFFPAGALNVTSYQALTYEDCNIMERFASVFGLIYTRFLDLQKAEAQAKDALRQSSLDRVRGEIASMRSTEDLNRITPLVWKELTAMNIPFIRCGVFIMNKEQNQIHTYLSTPDGRAIAAFHTPLDAPGNFTDAVNHWHEQKMYVTHWVEKDFKIQADELVLQGAIATRDQYLNAIPKEGFHLHFFPFRQGMLYVGSMTQLQSDDLQLVQALAETFSVAYSRYEDFKQLEEAKKRVEVTLTELKSTQSQLIQSEKMASLGELTAGIAHEIQNPLNFVNNFSEVSNELIDEMKVEQVAGNWSLAAEIADDVKSNLEKILHHGKRADAIVKGMLQHSRSSSDAKEPTDINTLCDEYLRLAYHGLRAKDKSFNAKFEVDFDFSLPKLNVVPQDIGRVVLNLINNAFYAVNEQRAACNEQRDPLVMVSTKNLGSKIEIRVTDNGNGIAESIKEKIFQPFFTTKPTGQGTGLGLSLSYDIVKAHGGELKVETKEGEGTTFIIKLSNA